jgi:hypothetical protein
MEPKVHYSQDSILSQINSPEISRFKVHSNISFHLHLGLPSGLLPSGFQI